MVKKAINNGIYFNDHPPTFGIDKAEIQQCVCKGVFMDFLEWKASEKHIYDITQMKDEEYKQDN